MKNKFENELKSTGLIIITMNIIAIVLYASHYIIFGELKATASGLLLSLAYVPIGVIFNILILDKIFEKSNEIRLERRMNMIIGSFFHEIGNDLMNSIVIADENIDLLNYVCDSSIKWDNKDFKKLSEIIKNYNCKINIDNINLKLLKTVIENKEDFILDLLINSSLDEYEGFSEMLIRILHVRDEFNALFIDDYLKEEDKVHMSNDICDAYKYLLCFRVNHIKSIKEYYPLMFTKSIKNSPFSVNCK